MLLPVVRTLIRHPYFPVALAVLLAGIAAFWPRQVVLHHGAALEWPTGNTADPTMLTANSHAPAGIAASPDGTLWVVETDVYRLAHLDIHGRVLTD